MIIERFVVPPFGENTYLLGDPDSGDAIVIDPGGRAAEIVAAAGRHGLEISRIVNTHAHVDHVAGVSDLQERTNAAFWLHAEAEPMLERATQSAAMFGLDPFDIPAVDRRLVPGEPVALGAIALDVRFTPGHAPGHVTLVTPPFPFEGSTRPVAFCGDVIFRGSIGRTDLEGGDHALLMDVIEREIMGLPDETVLLSGHGPPTTVGAERKANPFVQAWRARSEHREASDTS